MVDRFRFWVFSRNSFQGAISIVMKTSTVFGPNFGGGGEAKASEGAPHAEERQASDSIM